MSRIASFILEGGVKGSDGETVAIFAALGPLTLCGTVVASGAASVGSLAATFYFLYFIIFNGFIIVRFRFLCGVFVLAVFCAVCLSFDCV